MKMNMKMKTGTWDNARVGADDAGRRLDQILSEQAGVTRSAAVRLIEDGAVLLNGSVARKNARPAAGDLLEWMLPEPEPAEAAPENIPLDVVYEDDDLIVVNKPVGMVVHPAAGNRTGTLVNALLWHCGASLSGIGGVVRPGIVHRIDKDTSGLLAVAKNDAAHLALAAQIKEHRVARVYTAVAVGNLREDAGTVNAPIGRHPTDRKRMAVIRDGKGTAREAVTHWNVLGRAEADGSRFTLLRCALETGRTHQIRVHLASVGHPLLGDPVYGGDRTAFEARHRTIIKGQCLHAGQLTLTHPRTGQEMTFTAPPPEPMRRVIAILFGNDLAGTLFKTE